MYVDYKWEWVVFMVFVNGVVEYGMYMYDV